MGRIDLGIFDANTIYASIADATTGSATNLGIWVTTNGGTSWTQTQAPDICQPQCWYDDVVKVDPNNKDIVYFGGSSVSLTGASFDWVLRSTNGTVAGGGTFSSTLPTSQGPGLPHVDQHAIAFFKPTTGPFANQVRLYLGNDGGIWRTDDAEASTVTWTNINDSALQLTQYYPNIAIHASNPVHSFDGTQDNGSLTYQGGTAWVDNGLCGDGASAAADQIVPSTIYVGCATGAPINVSVQAGALGTFVPAVNGINPGDFADFIPPLTVDTTQANVLYFGTTKVYQSVNAGLNWAALSPDLTSTDGTQYLTALAVSPKIPSVVYAGANAGGVFVSTNVTAGSGTFNQVTGQASLPTRDITAMAVDPADPTGKTMYVAVSGFSFVGGGISDTAGHIFKTTDAGATWTDISCSTANCTTPATTDLPNTPVNDLVVDPDIPGTIYAATDIGVYVTSDGGAHWSTLGVGLPHVAVLSLRLHEPSRTLRAATHGRGAWDVVLNNFTPNNPHIATLSPTDVPASSGSFPLTVTGVGLTAGSIQWNGSTTGIIQNGGTDTSISATIPTTLLGSGGTPKIAVHTTVGTSNALTFVVQGAPPTLSGISPVSAPVETPNPTTPFPINLTGTNFGGSSQVLFNGAAAGITTSSVTGTSMTATLPAALLGPFGSTNDITVFNPAPGGGSSTAATFTVVAPPTANDNFANATIISSSTFTVTEDTSGATTQSSDPLLSCVSQQPGGNNQNGSFNTVWFKFTPATDGILSDVDTIGSSYDTTLAFLTGSQGGLNEIACNDDINPGIVVQSQLQSIPLTGGTTYYIFVGSFGPPDPNPIALGGKLILNFTFFSQPNNPFPAITTLSPTSATTGGAAFSLTVNGTNFVTTSTVNWNGSARTTTFGSTTQLTAAIAAADIATSATVPITVTNPAPGGGTSAAINFTVGAGGTPNFTMTPAAPTSVTVSAGNPATYSVAIAGTNGFSEMSALAAP